MLGVLKYATRLNLEPAIINNLLNSHYEAITLKYMSGRMVLYGKLPNDVNELIYSADASDTIAVYNMRKLNNLVGGELC